jgi:hypothetical protein
MGVGILDPNEPRDDFKLVYRAETKLNPPAQRKATTRKNRAPVVVPTPHPIAVGDVVISRDYMSAGSYRKLFAGTGIIRAITNEQRRTFSGKAYQVRRMTVMMDGRRVDVLESMLQFVSSANPVAYHNPADSGGTISELNVKPAPMPEKVQVIDLYPLLLAPPQIAGYLPARTKDNAATTFYAALMAGRAKYQPKVQAGENVSGGVEHKPSYQGAYNNSMHNWSGR